MVMIRRVQKAVKKASKLPIGLSRPMLKSVRQPADDDMTAARAYIQSYWNKLLREHKKDEGTLIGLPHPYLVPSVGHAEFLFEEQYYWDTYFTVIGLAHPLYEELVDGMLENLLYLLHRFGLVPNASRMYFTSRSQPPLLTTLIFHVYDTYNKSPQWLEKRILQAKQEYENVWMSRAHPQWHNVHQNLSRYYDINVLHDLAEAESGWDMTPRFERKCLDFLPVDLNALLYKYEMDFARAAEIMSDSREAARWRSCAEERKATMDRLMWGKIRGFYFDYNYVKGEQSGVWSLAAYYTLWAGMADQTQANRLVENIDKFEKKGGLTTTTRPLIDMTMFGSIRAQWAYPNGWAPLHYIVIEGLQRYGYHDIARRIAARWLATNTQWFKQTGVFQEKYNVVNPKKPPVEGLYPSQEGFGWTNGVFEYLCQKYIDEAR